MFVMLPLVLTWKFLFWLTPLLISESRQFRSDFFYIQLQADMPTFTGRVIISPLQNHIVPFSFTNCMRIMCILSLKSDFQKIHLFQISFRFPDEGLAGVATNVHCTIINVRHRFHWLTKSEFVGLIGPGNKSRNLFYHWQRSIFDRFIQLYFIQVKDHVLVVICTWSHETE